MGKIRSSLDPLDVFHETLAAPDMEQAWAKFRMRLRDAGFEGGFFSFGGTYSSADALREVVDNRLLLGSPISAEWTNFLLERPELQEIDRLSRTAGNPPFRSITHHSQPWRS